MNIYGQISSKVYGNPKCAGCLHFLAGQDACSVGQKPTTCGDGANPDTGYAPLAATGPGEAVVESPSHAESARAGQVTANDVKIAVAHFGDESELLALSQRAINDLRKSRSTCVVHSNAGGLNIHAVEGAFMGCVCETVNKATVAAKLFSFLDERSQRRVRVDAIEKAIEKFSGHLGL